MIATNRSSRVGDMRERISAVGMSSGISQYGDGIVTLDQNDGALSCIEFSAPSIIPHCDVMLVIN